MSFRAPEEKLLILMVSDSDQGLISIFVAVTVAGRLSPGRVGLSVQGGPSHTSHPPKPPNGPKHHVEFH
jgi:hypothetical protein